MDKHKVITALRAALEGIPIPYKGYECLFAEDYSLFGIVHENQYGEKRISALSEITLSKFCDIADGLSEEDFIGIVFALGMLPE